MRIIYFLTSRHIHCRVYYNIISFLCFCNRMSVQSQTVILTCKGCFVIRKIYSQGKTKRIFIDNPHFESLSGKDKTHCQKERDCSARLRKEKSKHSRTSLYHNSSNFRNLTFIYA